MQIRQTFYFLPLAATDEALSFSSFTRQKLHKNITTCDNKNVTTQLKKSWPFFPPPLIKRADSGQFWASQVERIQKIHNTYPFGFKNFIWPF